jgi:hypothetical protein
MFAPVWWDELDPVEPAAPAYVAGYVLRIRLVVLHRGSTLNIGKGQLHGLLRDKGYA